MLLPFPEKDFHACKFRIFCDISLAMSTLRAREKQGFMQDLLILVRIERINETVQTNRKCLLENENIVEEKYFHNALPNSAKLSIT